jgi:hypothetical protein
MYFIHFQMSAYCLIGINTDLKSSRIPEDEISLDENFLLN